ncbi:uncharacterized mitochondrial protein AtMg00310-like [Tripterygium wilfordii]|uniref:uncharacterized mitochondrial protein AtMg00310-like n=1 Tax=Tripterygium wilfordii TaxID=458696 RepID=UPI0018F844D1|nr:uncharacterized mitochondrial protein AtMg00310-like [Tripterygium wilfordii]
MMNSFWWGSGSGGSRGINWMRWDRLCVRKYQGRLGFCKLHEFNLAMLGKSGWRLLLHPDSLVGRLYKSRYYPNSNFLEATLSNNPSYIWRSIIASQPLVRSGAQWRVGKGDRIKIWTDSWLPDDSNPRVMSLVIQGSEEAVVRGLIRTDERLWDQDILRDLFNDRDRDLINKIPLSCRDNEDRIYWRPDRKGEYTV